MKLRVPPVTARNVTSAVSPGGCGGLYRGLRRPRPRDLGDSQGHSTAQEGQAADGRWPLEHQERRLAHSRFQSQERQASIFVTPRRGARSKLGTLEIPTIGLKRAFYEGVHGAVVKMGPGHWPGTPFPGNAGNAVFAGHRTTYTKPFADLDLLDRGDPIRTTVGKNKRLVPGVEGLCRPRSRVRAVGATATQEQESSPDNAVRMHSQKGSGPIGSWCERRPVQHPR